MLVISIYSCLYFYVYIPNEIKQTLFVWFKFFPQLWQCFSDLTYINNTVPLYRFLDQKLTFVLKDAKFYRDSVIRTNVLKALCLPNSIPLLNNTFCVVDLTAFDKSKILKTKVNYNICRLCECWNTLILNYSLCNPGQTLQYTLNIFLWLSY